VHSVPHLPDAFEVAMSNRLLPRQIPLFPNPQLSLPFVGDENEQPASPKDEPAPAGP